MSELVNDASARERDRVVPGAEIPEPVDFSGGTERGRGKDTYHAPRSEPGFEKAMASAHAGSPEAEEASATGGIGKCKLRAFPCGRQRWSFWT
jgi:hypothetical protein